jgi:Inositol-pentakisphosphate 2-kinase
MAHQLGPEYVTPQAVVQTTTEFVSALLCSSTHGTTDRRPCAKQPHERPNVPHQQLTSGPGVCPSEQQPVPGATGICPSQHQPARIAVGLQPDHTRFGGSAGSAGDDWGALGTLCVELKPKCGFLPSSAAIHPDNAIKRRLPRFVLHQALKLARVGVNCS